MLEKKERVIITSAVSISALILIAVVIWRVALESSFFTPAPQNQAARQQFQTEHFHHEHSPSGPLIENAQKFTKTDTQPHAEHKPSLKDVIRAARGWKPAYHYWFGRKAPDFTLTDINGKKHTLSDYRGKNVMIIFWATWCGPCLIEIPHLIALRNIISEDKLAMLAISHISPLENPEKVKRFVERRKINYTVFSVDVAKMSAPYNRITGIPCTFFIDPQGKIKLATEGALSLGEIKAILQAE